MSQKAQKPNINPSIKIQLKGDNLTPKEMKIPDSECVKYIIINKTMEPKVNIRTNSNLIFIQETKNVFDRWVQFTEKTKGLDYKLIFLMEQY